MTDSPVRSGAVSTLSIASIARESWTTFGRDRRALLLLAAVLEVPLVLVEVALHITPGLRSIVDNEALAPLVALATVYGSLSHHFLAGLLERVVGSERHGHARPKLNDVLRHLPWHRLVIADVVLTTLIVAGFAALIVPGVLAMTWFALVLPIINLEGQPVLASFRRSIQLVKASPWRVGIIAITSFAVPELIIASVLVVTHTGNVVIDAIAHAVPAILLLPLAALPIVITTFDLVDRESASPGARFGPGPPSHGLFAPPPAELTAAQQHVEETPPSAD